MPHDFNLLSPNIKKPPEVGGFREFVAIFKVLSVFHLPPDYESKASG